MVSKKKSASAKKQQTISFDFIKSNQFRVIHVDGAWGGIAAPGHIHMSFFSERTAIPQQITHVINSDGSLGEEVKDKRKGRDAIVREVEVDAVMSLHTAISIRDWLDRKIEEMQRLAELADQLAGGNKSTASKEEA
jgi:hypothetical protein